MQRIVFDAKAQRRKASQRVTDDDKAPHHFFALFLRQNLLATAIVSGSK
jgi:hypothetical protein